LLLHEKKQLWGGNMPNKQMIITITIALAIGMMLGWALKTVPENTSEEHEHNAVKEDMTWTCSMHPQIQQPDPGKCAICGMNLIPMTDDSDSDNPFEIKMSSTALQLANVQTSLVKKEKAVKNIRINGKIKTAESQKYSQSSHISGRIERLMVGFTGEKIKKGQVLAWVYSPELVTAQKELLEALKTQEQAPQLLRAARAKLQNWKLSEKQIEKILQKGKVQEQVPIFADVSGTVLRKNVHLGDYIKKGQALFEIADLSTVWGMFDIYESDLIWVNTGDTVSFQTKSLPGQEFSGEVEFIDPVINPKTRVAMARVVLSNLDELLKPEQFILGTMQSSLKTDQESLIVPKSAVMWTGERSVVYVKNETENGVYFIMKEIVLGPSLGKDYIVLEGLEEGEEIASNGTFSIDAAAQLIGKASMMNPKGRNAKSMDEEVNKIEFSEQAKAELKLLFAKYIEVKMALVDDNFEGSHQHSIEMMKILENVDMGVFEGESHMVWMKHEKQLRSHVGKANATINIDELRGVFKPLSSELVALLKKVGSIDQPLYIEYCPMADNNNGGDWISTEPEIRNPYFGASMLGCGKILEEIR
jgi:Cu(I)/Ag(I) efflux system membrane fusion protein